MKVYFDNAATTPLDPEVFEAIKPFMLDFFGNPSSTHSHGRQVRSAIEQARKTIAELLNTSPGEIFFTSGGTEADNTIIRSNVEAHGIKRIISSPIEHHAVLHNVELLAKNKVIDVLEFVNLDNKGHIEMNHLEALLKEDTPTLVSLMHANNEIGNLNDIEQIGELCDKYGAIFHSDTVQTMGHYQHDLSSLKINGLACGAHKFHGPKGSGFMYIRKDSKIHPLMIGGGQERNMRGGTENVYGIIGTAKALEIAYRDMAEHQQYIQSLKDRMIEKLKALNLSIAFNGDSENAVKSLYTVLNVSLPASEKNDMLLFTMDLNNISVSGGSACNSGSHIGSHVLTALGADPNRGAIRLSFSKMNTIEEVDFVANKIADFYKS